MTFAKFLAALAFIQADPALNERLIEEVCPEPPIATEPVCGFVHDGFYNNGAETVSNLTVRQVSPIDVEIYVGDGVTVTLEVSNENCDWITIPSLTFSVSHWGNSPWIETLEAEQRPMTLSQPNVAVENTASGMNVSVAGEQLFYYFRDAGFAWNNESTLETVWLAPGEKAVVTFTFTATEDLVPGDVIEIRAETVWKDIATGETILELFSDETMITVL